VAICLPQVSFAVACWVEVCFQELSSWDSGSAEELASQDLRRESSYRQDWWTCRELRFLSLEKWYRAWGKPYPAWAKQSRASVKLYFRSSAMPRPD